MDEALRNESSPVEPAPSLHVILYEPEIAANVGSIGRTCVAVGARLWLVRPLGFHLDDRHRRRAGLDYWDRLDLRVVDAWDDVVAELGADRLWAFSTKAKSGYAEAAYRLGDALAFGPESRGLPPSILNEAIRRGRSARIPLRPEARSLNLACAVAVGVYEAVRQIGLDRENGPSSNRFA